MEQEKHPISSCEPRAIVPKSPDALPLSENAQRVVDALMPKVLQDIGFAPSSNVRAVVAMSGGVDSSVVASALKYAGFDVIGITLQLYDHGQAVHRKGACCAGHDIHDARTVAENIGIPHYVLNYESQFKKQVIDAFASSYMAGETPVPCIACNQTVKFTDMLRMSRELDARFLATGHYVVSRAEAGGASPHRKLLCPLDEKRDQSYFLFGTTFDQLEHLRFPLGELTKGETRDLARAFGLCVAEKKDSQDICFVPEGRYADIIERLKPGAGVPGEIVDVNGEVLGAHTGIINYTIGQRRGLGIAHHEPLYVIGLDTTANRVIVGGWEMLSTRVLFLREVNWIAGTPLEALCERPMRVYARIRSSRPPKPAECFVNEDGAFGVRLFEDEYGVAPGQACALYDRQGAGAQVLGGGWIKRRILRYETFKNQELL